MLRRSVVSVVLLGLFVCGYASANILDGIAGAKTYRSGRISSYDKGGGNADGGQGNPLKPGQMRTIAEIKGPGQIAHIWVTMGGVDKRDLILRMYWDGEKTPSVEAPIGEFFGLGHGKHYTYESAPFAIGNNSGMNCFLPMPFKKSAKVTIQNVGVNELDAFYYYIDYQLFDAPRNDLLQFHAQYRQEKPVLSQGNYTILSAVCRGHYVGCFLFVKQNADGWFGEGDDMIYIDGSKNPVLFGTGTEDYFCHAWGFGGNTSTARFGAPFVDEKNPEESEFTVYRFHAEDAIAFKKSIKVTIEHGHANNRSDDFSSVAYWYQTEPHAAFPALAGYVQRRSTKERKDNLLKEKRYAELRRWDEQIALKTGSPSVKQAAEFEIVDLLALEFGNERAVEALLDFAGLFPSPETVDKATAKIKQLGGSPDILKPAPVSVIRDVADGMFNVVKIDGIRCLKTDGTRGSPYIYFDVDDKILHDGDKPILLEIEYYNEGKPGDTFTIQYDSAFSEADADIYRETAVFPKPGVKGWNKAILFLDHARFSGRQNGGADFRLFRGKDADEYVRGIKVITKQ